MTQWKKAIATVLALALIGTCLAGCLKEDDGDGNGGAAPKAAVLVNVGIDEANETVDFMFALSDMEDYTSDNAQGVKRAGTVRVTLVDDTGFVMLDNKTYPITEADFETLEGAPVCYVEVPYADITQSSSTEFLPTMYGYLWFTFDSTTLEAEAFMAGISNMAWIPDELLAVNEAPTAGLEGPATGWWGEELEFNASTSSDPEDGDLTYDWDWGDGNTTMDGDAVETWTYEGQGTYTVEVTVTDDGDNTDSTTIDVDIEWAGLISFGGWNKVTEPTDLKYNNTYVDITIENRADFELDLGDLHPQLENATGGYEEHNGTDLPSLPTTVDPETTANIRFYFDIPDGWDAKKILLWDGEWSYDLP